MALARIHEPVESWADEYEVLREKIDRALGAVAIRIDHIGSTSVPGLAAKDVIDIQVTVAVLGDPQLVIAMTGAGFRLRPGAVNVERARQNGNEFDHVPRGADPGDMSEWEKRYFREPEGECEVHVHVRAAGRANQRYPLLFRDYLRTHPDTASTYEDFKRRLASLDIETGVYAEIKDPVCDLIMVAAERWAADTGWRAA
ncbi:MAG TPA: GrpB family protein [Tepidiformaceae bacterium]